MSKDNLGPTFKQIHSDIQVSSMAMKLAATRYDFQNVV